MSNKHYDEAKVVRSLSKKSSIRFTQTGTTKCIEIIKGCTDVGNGSWGKIDYLHKVHGYHAVLVKQFSSGSKKTSAAADDVSEKHDTKAAKRERKLNMATMAKSAMRKAKTK